MKKILGVKEIKPNTLKLRLKKLMSEILEVQINSTDFILIALFEQAYCVQSHDTGLWEIHMICTNSALEYFFNVQQIGYLKYKMKNIINLASRYSYLLFLYIEHNKFRKEWVVSVEELKQILDCDLNKSSEFKVFNREILKKATDEVNSKTDTEFAYSTTRIGRTVKLINFSIIESIISTEYIDDVEDVIPEYNNQLDLIKWACEDSFTTAQFNEIFEIIVVKEVPHTDMEKK